MNTKYSPTFEEPEKLLSIANPTIYRCNPFRVLQVPVFASAKTITTQLKKFDIMDKLSIPSDGEEYILQLTPLPDIDARRQAAHRLENPESRLIDEIFWFWPQDRLSNDDAALLALKQDQPTKAANIWQENASDRHKGYISLHNLAILYHVLSLDLEYIYSNKQSAGKEKGQKREYWNIAFRSWSRLFSEDGFWKFLAKRVKEFDDPRLTLATLQSIRRYLPQIILTINAELALRSAQKQRDDETQFHVSLMRSQDPEKSLLLESDISEVSTRIVKPFYKQIKLACDNASQRTTDTPEQGKVIALGVLEQIKPLLLPIDTLLYPGHLLYETAHDEIALCVMRSIVSYAIKTDDYSTVVQTLTYAETTAVSESALQQITENLIFFKEYSTCWFCKQSPSNSKSAYELAMYGNVQMEGVQIRWQERKVKIPRCDKCKSSHRVINRSDSLSQVGGVIFCIAIVTIFILFIMLVSD